MPQDVMVYWKLPEVRLFVENEYDLEGAIGKQLQRLSPGDTIWIVTIDSGELILCGPMLLGRVDPESHGQWRAKVKKGKEQQAKWINLTAVVGAIRFESDRDRFDFDTMGKIKAQQLQTNRILTKETADILRKTWRKGSVDENDSEQEEFVFPEENVEKGTLAEGALRRVTINAYERSDAARSKCLAHYGTTCVVCKTNLQSIYGHAAAGLIHVHHLQSLAAVGGDYEVDPIEDLRPVCPNCHAVIHRKKTPYSIEEVRDFIAQAKPNNIKKKHLN